LLSSIQDPSRLRTLRQYDVLKGPLAEGIDEVVDVARHLYEAPAAVVSVIGAHREWFQSRLNFAPTSLSIENAFGCHVLEAESTLLVEDATADPRFHDHPLVTNPPGIRFYAAAPLVTPDEQLIGTLAVLDTQPRTPSSELLSHLETLAGGIIDKLQRSTQDETAGRNPFLLDPTVANAAVLNDDGTILQVNQNWRTFAADTNGSVPSSVVPGANYLDACDVSADAPDREYARRARDGIRAVLRGTKPAFGMVYPCSPPEETRWFQMQVMALDLPQVSALVVHSDLTAQKRERQHRRLLKSAVEQASDIVLITEGTPLSDAGAQITYVNPTIEAVTGYRPNEITGVPVQSLFGPNTEPWVLNRLRQQIQRVEPFEGDVTTHRKDGSSYVSHWSMGPVRNEEGVVTHWVAVLRDVTEERQLQTRMLAAQERERRRIADRMHDEIGGLLTTLQVTIDTTLSNTAGASSGLGDINGVVRELSSVVRTLTDRLHSRVLEDYGLQEAVARLVREFNTERRITIDHFVDLPGEERFPHLIEKVAFRGIREALFNAARHAQTDRAQLVVHRKEASLHVHVTDHGVGFQSQDQLIENKRFGLLGLRERVERLNGTITIDTEPGLGTRISMILPLTAGPLHTE
jgi:PAS domain S-box-containing protein